MSETTDEARRTRGTATGLISQSTILILSGVLIGMAAGKAVRPDVENYVLFCGVAGLVAFIGLSSVARNRQQRATQLAVEKATTQLERRMDRHIASTGPDADVPQRRVRTNVVEQYLTVACHSRQKTPVRRGPGRFGPYDC